MRTEQEIRAYIKALRNHAKTDGPWAEAFGSNAHWANALEWALASFKQLPPDPEEEEWRAWEERNERAMLGPKWRVEHVDSYWGARGV